MDDPKDSGDESEHEDFVVDDDEAEEEEAGTSLRRLNVQSELEDCRSFWDRLAQRYARPTSNSAQHPEVAGGRSRLESLPPLPEDGHIFEVKATVSQPIMARPHIRSTPVAPGWEGRDRSEGALGSLH